MFRNTINGGNRQVLDLWYRIIVDKGEILVEKYTKETVAVLSVSLSYNFMTRLFLDYFVVIQLINKFLLVVQTCYMPLSEILLY
jgi:transposase